jgi:hypothetical protein
LAKEGRSRAVGSGDFYGDLDWVSTGGAWDIRSLAASGREDDVDTHTHEDAHFVLMFITLIVPARLAG